jgi:hypothetical protein
MSKARDISKIIDGSGNLVVNNASSDARSLGVVKADGTPLSSLDRTTVSASIATSNCSGIIPNGNCATAITNGYQDTTYNTSTTYINATGAVVNQPVQIAKPPNGNWWTWSGLGFVGVTTTNCANNGAYDGAGGNTSTLTPISVDNIFSGWTTTDELGGTYQTRTVQNCNCGSFNCRTNCNCNCACACACQCSTDA